MASIKIWISCASIHTPDNRMKKLCMWTIRIYINESVYAFIDSKLYSKAAFVWLTFHIFKKAGVYVAMTYPSDFTGVAQPVWPVQLWPHQFSMK